VARVGGAYLKPQPVCARRARVRCWK
jgi:hypothetical protein